MYFTMSGFLGQYRRQDRRCSTCAIACLETSSCHLRLSERLFQTIFDILTSIKESWLWNCLPTKETSLLIAAILSFISHIPIFQSNSDQCDITEKMFTFLIILTLGSQIFAFPKPLIVSGLCHSPIYQDFQSAWAAALLHWPLMI